MTVIIRWRAARIRWLRSRVFQGLPFKRFFKLAPPITGLVVLETLKRTMVIICYHALTELPWQGCVVYLFPLIFSWIQDDPSSICKPVGWNSCRINQKLRSILPVAASALHGRPCPRRFHRAQLPPLHLAAGLAWPLPSHGRVHRALLLPRRDLLRPGLVEGLRLAAARLPRPRAHRGQRSLGRPHGRSWGHGVCQWEPEVVRFGELGAPGRGVGFLLLWLFSWHHEIKMIKCNMGSWALAGDKSWTSFCRTPQLEFQGYWCIQNYTEAGTFTQCQGHTTAFVRFLGSFEYIVLSVGCSTVAATLSWDEPPRSMAAPNHGSLLWWRPKCLAPAQLLLRPGWDRQDLPKHTRRTSGPIFKHIKHPINTGYLILALNSGDPQSPKHQAGLPWALWEARAARFFPEQTAQTGLPSSEDFKLMFACCPRYTIGTTMALATISKYLRFVHRNHLKISALCSPRKSVRVREPPCCGHTIL